MKHLQTVLLVESIYEAGTTHGLYICEEGREPGSSRDFHLGGAWHFPVEQYRDLDAHCRELGLVASATSAQRLGDFIERAKEPVLAEWQRFQQELEGRLRDELGARMLMFIEPDLVRFYTEAHLFGEAVSNSFPSAILDIEEAGKCLALGRNTACAFHLMRVMETALRALGASLNDPTLDPTTNPSWDRILGRGDKELAKRAVDRSPEWKGKPDFFAAAHATLRSVSTAC